MFRKNNKFDQRKLFSFIQNLPKCVKDAVYGSFAPDFYENIFKQIDEEKFRGLYSEKYSRPNKPVNMLVSLEIIKQLFGYTDQELIRTFYTDICVMCAVGVEDPGDVALAIRTLYYFRERVVEYDKKHGTSLINEVLNDISEHLIDKHDIDIRLQRMDSSMIEANIKVLTRLNIFVKVIHNFLKVIDKEISELPEDLQSLSEKKNLDISHRLKKKEAEKKINEFAEYAYLLYEKYKDNDKYNTTKRFKELKRLIEEQFDITDDSDKGDIEVSLKDSKDVPSSSLQSPTDPDAAYSFKNRKHHSGYVGNFAESCSKDNPFQVITDVEVKPNNISDKALLSESLKDDTSFVSEAEDLLTDGAYFGKETEKECDEAGMEIHLSGIRGKRNVKNNRNLADAIVEDNKLIRCPAGQKPTEQEYIEKEGKTAYIKGRFEMEKCLKCPMLKECFVKVNKTCVSFRFTLREYDIKSRRKKLDDPEYLKFVNLRSGAESMIYMIFYKIGKRTIFRGLHRVKNGILYRAIGVNLLRLRNYLKRTRAKQAKKASISLSLKNIGRLFSLFCKSFRILIISVHN